MSFHLEPMYPFGYQSQTTTLKTLKSLYADKMHPEYARRLFTWLVAQGGKIGIGSAWRVTPHPVSPASMRGQSFHQDQRIDGGDYCTAVDLVALNDGKPHRSPRWSEVMIQGGAVSRDWGLHCNVPGEPWHMQPIELDGWQTWVASGRPGLWSDYPLPGDAAPVPPVGGLPPFSPETGLFSLWPVNESKPRLAQEAFVAERLSRGFSNWSYRGEAVRYLQGVMLHKAGGRITVDGHYGPVTAARVEDLQRQFGREVDGLVGPVTWQIIDFLALRDV